MFKKLFVTIALFSSFSSNAMMYESSYEQQKSEPYDVGPAVKKLLALKESNLEAYQRLNVCVIKSEKHQFNATVNECNYDSVLAFLYSQRFLLNKDGFLQVNPLYLLLLRGVTDIEKYFSYDQFQQYL